MEEDGDLRGAWVGAGEDEAIGDEDNVSEGKVLGIGPREGLERVAMVIRVMLKPKGLVTVLPGLERWRWQSGRGC